jgi:propionyl-CoA carboxylase alpha chain
MEATTSRSGEEPVSTYTMSIGSSSFSVTIHPDGSISVNGRPVSVSVREIDSTTFLVSGAEATTRVVGRCAGTEVEVLLSGEQHTVSVVTEREALIRTYGRRAGSDHIPSEIHAPMPALVVRVEVHEGDEVETGQGLCVLEAMKMENELKAHRSGRVKQVLVKQGNTVEKNELLMILE